VTHYEYHGYTPAGPVTYLALRHTLLTGRVLRSTTPTNSGHYWPSTRHYATPWSPRSNPNPAPTRALVTLATRHGAAAVAVTFTAPGARARPVPTGAPAGGAP